GGRRMRVSTDAGVRRGAGFDGNSRGVVALGTNPGVVAGDGAAPAGRRGRSLVERSQTGGRRGARAAGPAAGPDPEVSVFLVDEPVVRTATATAEPGRPAAGAPPRERVLVHAAGDLVVAAECEYRLLCRLDEQLGRAPRRESADDALL